jgi:hypothetical protein
VLLAVTLTAIGFAYDAGSGNKELSMVFSALYALGCIFAVLAVRQSGIFTAVIQPPLILFGAVPTAYFLFHGGQLGGIKDIAINCGYPLIERFPLMFFTSAAVLLIGMGRWYYGMSSRRSSTRSTGENAKEKTGSRVSSVTSKMSSLLTGDVADVEETDADADESPRRKHTIDRPTRAAKPSKSASGTARTPRTTKRAAPPRSRHARPPETEVIEPVAERPRRQRAPRQGEQPPPAEPPRRRPRTSSSREPRKAVPPERRAPYERSERPERRRRYEDYPPREPHVSNGNGTHHPVSRVRYRGGADESDNRAEHRTRPRSSRSGWEAESWEYDI